MFVLPNLSCFLKSVVYYRRNYAEYESHTLNQFSMRWSHSETSTAVEQTCCVSSPQIDSPQKNNLDWISLSFGVIQPKKKHIPVRFQNTQHGHCYNGKFIQIMKISIGYRNITTLLYRLNFWSLLQTHHGPWSIFRCLFCGNCSFGVTILQSYRSHRMGSSGMEAIALKK